MLLYPSPTCAVNGSDSGSISNHSTPISVRPKASSKLYSRPKAPVVECSSPGIFSSLTNDKSRSKSKSSERKKPDGDLHGDSSSITPLHLSESKSKSTDEAHTHDGVEALNFSGTILHEDNNAKSVSLPSTSATPFHATYYNYSISRFATEDLNVYSDVYETAERRIQFYTSRMKAFINNFDEVFYPPCIETEAALSVYRASNSPLQTTLPRVAFDREPWS